MFATVRFGADCQIMVNLLCCVQTLTGHLKWKCQCRPEDCIDLVDEKGTLMNLSKVEDPASEYASRYLQGRQRYVLIRVVRKNSEATSYESLLEDLGKHYPDLPDQLEQLSGKIQQTEQRRRSSEQRKKSSEQRKKSSEQRKKSSEQRKKSSEQRKKSSEQRKNSLQSAQPQATTQAKGRTTLQSKRGLQSKHTPK